MFLACFETIHTVTVPYQAIQAVTSCLTLYRWRPLLQPFFEMSPLLGVQRIAGQFLMFIFWHPEPMVNKGWFVNKLRIRPSFLGGCVRGGIMLISHDMGPLNCCSNSVYGVALVTPHRCSSVPVLISQGPMLYKLSGLTFPRKLAAKT